MAIAPVTPEQMGLAGAQQLAQVQRTRLGPGASFVAENLINAASLAAKLSPATEGLAKSLRAALPAKVRKKLSPANGTELDAGVPAALVRGLNKLAQGPSLYEAVRFPENILARETRELREQKPKGKLLAQFNRLLLRDAYPQEISTAPTTETDGLATSREAAQWDAESFLGANREYWGIENGTHQRLDCSALEDRLRIRDPNAVAVLGLFHRMSITLFMAWTKTQRNPRDRTYPTWQSVHSANRWIMIQQVMKAPA